MIVTMTRFRAVFLPAGGIATLFADYEFMTYRRCVRRRAGLALHSSGFQWQSRYMVQVALELWTRL